MTAAAHTVSRPTHPTGENVAPPGTLAGEHAALMRDLDRRATPVLTLLEQRAWPHAELGTLTTFLRSAMLRQASDEEVLLFPHDASAPPFVELSADHVRLHTLTAQLERVHADPCPPQELHALIDDLLKTLQRHLRDEQAVFAALPDAPTDIPTAAALAAGEQSWPSDDGPVLTPLDTPARGPGNRIVHRTPAALNPGQAPRSTPTTPRC
jgi:Hemerythrin HHE cation binding domain